MWSVLDPLRPFGESLSEGFLGEKREEIADMTESCTESFNIAWV